MWLLSKPEYFWRPSQVLRRFSYRPSNEIAPLTLPWHCTISACSAEVIGRSIATQGVYDLPLTEAIMRLTDAGDTALDLGANIGYTALVFALSAGPRGRVICFEPNSALLPTLIANVARWKSLRAADIAVEKFAISDHDGDDILGFPDDYARNHGVASLGLTRDAIPVIVHRLDSLKLERAEIMKVDVEGHEAAVFAGAEKLLARKQFRDVLFEEHEKYPARSHEILLEHGYHIFRVTRSTWRPLLLAPEASARQAYLPPNYLATADPARAQARFAAWGWRALSDNVHSR